ncbi:T-cell surface glycoprotein CD3 epsilon chain-like [Mobula birostris]|uniref:T-cell surface glycoprotein CD3 epsilon chain-like n=1 Tax=Mobula birostris TaxID=1983395 RepID=UPI003B287BB0
MLWTFTGIVLTATLLLQGGEAQANKGRVKVEADSVILTCPLLSTITWFRKTKGNEDSKIDTNDENYRIQNFGEQHNGKYYCKNSTSKYYFYIRARVCADCIELDTGVVIGIICGDLALTLIVAGLVYWFAKRRGPSSKDFRSLGADDFPPSRPPHMTSAHQAEYAPIKSGQREVYDKLQKR